MAQLRQEYAMFVEQETEVLIIGHEGPEEFRSYWDEKDMPMPGLADPDLKVLKLYGQQVSIFKLGRMPAQMIIDREGYIQYAHYANSMSDIPSNREVLGLLRELNQAWNSQSHPYQAEKKEQPFKP